MLVLSLDFVITPAIVRNAGIYPFPLPLPIGEISFPQLGIQHCVQILYSVLFLRVGSGYDNDLLRFAVVLP